MTARADLAPKTRLLVMDILQSLGMDVSKWADMKGGATRAASNPKYCYNWSFLQPGEFVVACLWYESLKQRSGELYYEINRGKWIKPRTEPGTGSSNKRANDFDQHLWLAYSEALPLRVIFVDGPQSDGTKPSKVNARRLDDTAWAITEYDLATGRCVMVRGTAPLPVKISAEDLELSGFEGTERSRFVIHRRREGAMRRAKISEALSKTGKLVCEVPKCGFDFEARYGSLGKGYAQVHHLTPLHKAPPEGRKIKLSDLAIVCANCHAMIHAGGECRELARLIR
ncbi:HNH endonuclease [Bradyrhizobium sp. BTAi1]|uniref:HNH endonuclease n=1 Tax=Bradyrhizobium sp. (strain BTAi1 / ATCC BAA-1182) TaxID=288000 RepID=UPI000151960B|nr:HNH endonuclease [Bradyrhizobium sp. BTAi1]ABQ36958.1 hypothetical protein BBta_4943 [Bradyrhizobium sp. BTAi1]